MAAGGQAKRTNIGVALISAPRILFLDEPTSGLDSYTSLEALAGCSMGALPGVVMRLLTCPYTSSLVQVMQHVAALTAPAEAGIGARSSGMTICATIHSPTPATFALFGRVIILLRGQMVFFGDNGARGPGHARLLLRHGLHQARAWVQGARQHITLPNTFPTCRLSRTA